MKSGVSCVITLVLFITSSCQSISKSTVTDQAASTDSSEDRMAKEIAEHRDVVLSYPSAFGYQVRNNDLGRARTSAETMYRTLARLESDKSIASQVCFGGSEWACKNFKSFMAADIKTLYHGFVLNNTLSTGELFRLAANIEVFSDLDYQVRVSH